MSESPHAACDAALAAAEDEIDRLHDVIARMDRELADYIDALVATEEKVAELEAGIDMDYNVQSIKLRAAEEKVAALEAQNGCCEHYNHCELLTPDGICQVHGKLAEYHRERDATESKLSIAVAALERIGAMAQSSFGQAQTIARAALTEIKGQS